MRSPQMIGVELPSPGIATFHLMFSVSLHFVGGSPCGATPLCCGPRQAGHCEAGSICCAADCAWQTASNNIRQQKKRIIYFPRADEIISRMLILSNVIDLAHSQQTWRSVAT